SSADGPLTLTGTGQGASSSNPGIDLTSAAGIRTGTGLLTIEADEMDFRSSTFLTGNGEIVLQPRSAGRDITLGGTSDLDASLTLTPEALTALIRFSGITFGREDGTGLLRVVSDINASTDLRLRTPGPGSRGINLVANVRAIGHNLTLDSGSSITT